MDQRTRLTVCQPESLTESVGDVLLAGAGHRVVFADNELSADLLGRSNLGLEGIKESLQNPSVSDGGTREESGNLTVMLRWLMRLGSVASAFLSGSQVEYW